MCLLGGYILIGAIYRYYFLGIHSVEVKLVLHKYHIHVMLNSAQLLSCSLNSEPFEGVFGLSALLTGSENFLSKFVKLYLSWTKKIESEPLPESRYQNISKIVPEPNVET